MAEETVRVVAVRGDRILVEPAMERGCGGCPARAGCGSGVLAGLFGRRSRRFEAVSEQPHDPGDRLVVGIPRGSLTRGALLVYLLPLIGMMLAALVAELIVARSAQYGEGLVVISALLGFGAGLLPAWLYGRRGRCQHSAYPVVLRRAGPADSAPGVHA
jgi:sigma-E factor negative regulatory protein RseC